MDNDIMNDTDAGFMDTSLKIEMLAQRRAMLALPADTVAEAERRSAVAKLDVPTLEKEWVNDALTSAESFDEAIKDSSASFLSWVDRKVLDPYLLPARATSLAALRLEDEAMKFSTIVWDQEIAWAKRLRRSQDIATALLSHFFLLRARKDVIEQFKALFPIYLVAREDFGYSRLHVHELTPEQIRIGMGSSEFEPLFLKHARSAFEAQLSNVLDMDNLDSIVAKIRLEEESEIQGLVRQRTVRMLERSRLTRMVSVIRTAIDIGLDTEMLDRAYESFLEQIRAGAIRFDVQSGLPDGDFRSWLRVQAFKRPPLPDGPIRNAANNELFNIAQHPAPWVAALPEEYHSLGGGVTHIFQGWLHPIVGDARPAPRDFVLDYGFHLVNTSLVRKSANAS